MTTGSHTTFLKKTALRLCWGLCMSGGQTKKYKTRGERIFRNVWGKIVSHLHRFGVLTLSFSVVGLDYKHSSQVSRNPTIQAEPHLINIVVLSLGFVLLGYFFFSSQCLHKGNGSFFSSLECMLCVQNPSAKTVLVPAAASECTTNRITINKMHMEFLKLVNTYFPARGIQ